MNINKAIFYIPIVGFSLAVFFLFGYSINTYLKGIPIGISLIMFGQGLIFFGVTYGLFKLKRWAYKIALLFSFLSLFSLLKRTDIVEITVVISGFVLLINRKSYSIKSEIEKKPKA